MNFALIGAAGYIAPRHMEAIKNIGGNLVAIVDLSDSVGVVDRYFPNAKYFRNIEALQFLELDYVTICTPNWLHYHHIYNCLDYGFNVICEKPLVIYSYDIDILKEIEQENKKRVFPVLQLRNHPNIIELKNKINSGHIVEIDYVTPRGQWYYDSWKGNKKKSGGIVFNIGVHLFDLVDYLFGNVISFTVDNNQHNKASGALTTLKATVKWRLSIDINDLPNDNSEAYRVIIVDGEILDLTHSFTELHTKVYQDILNGQGYDIAELKNTIELLNSINSIRL